MPKYLSQHQIHQFHEMGFLSPVDVMSEHEAGIFRQRLEEVERSYPSEINAENRNNPHLSFKFMDEIAHHSVILDAVEDLLGEQLFLWGTVLFIKEPESEGFVSWHQDATYMGLEPHDFVTPWLALTHSNRENGCMSMIPSSHKNQIQTHHDTFHDDNILTRGQEIRDIDESHAVDLILKPGQMSLHHAKIIHGSKPNRSQQRRIGAAMQSYASSQSRQVLGENYWQLARGNHKNTDHTYLERPQYDMDPIGVSNRKLVNENWANLLYHGAEKKRAY